MKKIDADMDRKRIVVNLTSILESKWQGVSFKARMEVLSINKGYFSWLKNWKSCPTSVVVEFFNLFYQTLPTLCLSKVDVILELTILPVDNQECNALDSRFKIQDYISQQKLHPLYDTQNTGT